jgi:hypothetical protein
MVKCNFAKHATLRRNNKDWLARNQDNVSEWGDMSTCGLLFQWTSTIKIQLSVLVACLAEKQQIPILVFGLTRPGLEPTLKGSRLTIMPPMRLYIKL